MTNTTESLMELRKLAEAATPGKRYRWVNNREGGTYVQLSAGSNDLCCRIEIASTTQADIDFIAATDPAKVIELLDAITELVEERDALKDQIDIQAGSIEAVQAANVRLAAERDALAKGAE